MESLIVIPDLHIPDQDRRSMDAVWKYMGDVKVDKVVQIGDYLDLSCISDHNNGKPRLTEMKRLEKDFREGEQWLVATRSVVGAKAEIVVLEGNHDERLERYIDKHPELEGSLSIPKVLNFEKYNVRWMPYWSKGQYLKVGKAGFAHGLYTNEHHAKKMVQNYGHSMFYGHTHDIQCYSQIMQGNDKTIVGQSLGCLCDYGQTYMRGKPNKWQQAFGHFYFHEGGYYTYFVVMVFNHKFIGPNGKEYRG